VKTLSINLTLLIGKASVAISEQEVTPAAGEEGRPRPAREGRWWPGLAKRMAISSRA
jgi:hypothetical protein